MSCINVQTLTVDICGKAVGPLDFLLGIVSSICRIWRFVSFCLASLDSLASFDSLASLDNFDSLVGSVKCCARGLRLDLLLALPIERKL